MGKYVQLNESNLLVRRSKMISDLIEDGLLEKHLERKNTKPSKIRIVDLISSKENENPTTT